jgi:hypothetical protein
MATTPSSHFRAESGGLNLTPSRRSWRRSPPRPSPAIHPDRHALLLTDLHPNKVRELSGPPGRSTPTGLSRSSPHRAKLWSVGALEAPAGAIIMARLFFPSVVFLALHVLVFALVLAIIVSN